MTNSNVIQSINIEGSSIVELARHIIKRFDLFQINIDEYKQKEFEYQSIEKIALQKIKKILGKKIFRNNFEKKITQINKIQNEKIILFIKILSHLYSNGYFFGVHINKLLDNDNNKKVNNFCGIIYMTSCFLDYILDNHKYMFPYFVNQLISEIKKKLPNIDIKFESECSNNTIDIINKELICKISQNFVSTLESIIKRNVNIKMEYKNLIETTLKTQISRYSGDEIKYNSYNEIYNFLKIKNTYIAWGLGLACLSYSNEENLLKINYWKKNFLICGDYFWIIDDIIDYSEDYINKKWNYLILKNNSTNGFEK